MDDRRLDRIENKLDQLFEINMEQNSVLERHSVLHEKNTEDLAVHIKRTNILEEQMKEALLPIEWIRVTAKILAILAPIIAAIYGLYKTFH